MNDECRSANDELVSQDDRKSTGLLLQILIGVTATLVWSGESAQAAVQWKTIALSGVDNEFGPQLGPGITFARVELPDVNATNHLAYRGSLGNSRGGIWHSDLTKNEAIAIVDRTGSQPDSFRTLGEVSLDDCNTIAFEGTKKSPTSESLQQDIWLHRDGQQTLAVRPEDHGFITFARSRLTNGNVVFSASNHNRMGLYSAADNSVQPLALPGTDGPQGPGLGPGVSFNSIHPTSFRLDASGDPLFHGQVSGSSFNNTAGIWRATPGNPRPIALVGVTGNLGPALGQDMVFSHIHEKIAYTDGANEVAFEAGFLGDEEFGRGVFRSGPNGNTLVALAESEGPLGPQLGPGRSFGLPAAVSINKRGNVLIIASLVGQTGSQRGIWLNSETGNIPIALTNTDGQYGPQLGRGQKFLGVGEDAYVDDAGYVFFQGVFRSSDPDAEPESGLWAWSNGNLMPILRQGDILAGRQVSGFSFGRMEDGARSDFPPTTDGFIAVQVTFDDESTGIFVAQIPEPSAMALAVTIVMSTLLWRWTTYKPRVPFKRAGAISSC